MDISQTEALDLLRKWQDENRVVQPGTRNGEAVAVREPMEVGFNLY